MNKYTVMLLLPESMTDGRKETYLTHVWAKGPENAAMLAQVEATATFDGTWIEDFEVLAVLDGWVSDISETHKATKTEEDERECKLCLIERVSEFAFDNVECYRNDTTGVAADIAYLLWAIAADTTFLWGTEAPDGLIKLLLEHDTDLLKELMDKGYIVKETVPDTSGWHDQDPVRNMAEVAAVVACAVTDNEAKLGNEGWIAHYSKIVDIAEEFSELFPLGFNWEAHMDNGGDCWDVEVGDFVTQWLQKNANQVGEWD